MGVSQGSFAATRNFYDDNNYPRVMARSGDFSMKEAQLIEKYGVVLTELSTGILKPATEDEQHFVDVCRGVANADSELEKAWFKYQNRILSPKQFHTLFGRTKVESLESEAVDLELDDDM